MEHNVAVPVTDPDSLFLHQEHHRRLVRLVVDERRHTLTFGPPGSGRTSAIHTAATVVERQGGVVVHWSPTDADFEGQGVAVRSLLSAVIERAGRDPRHGPSVRRWRERTWLGDTRALDREEQLVTGLALARGASDYIDSHLLSTDFAALRTMLVGDAGSVCVVMLDDAELFCEDIDLLEALLGVFDAAGWVLMLAGRAACRRSLREARSSGLRRIEAVELTPPSPREVEELLAAGGRFAQLMPSQSASRLDLGYAVYMLTSGLPVQAVLVRRALVEDAQARGGAMQVSVAVLRRAVELLADVSRRSDDLRRLQRITDGELERALRIVPYHRMSLRQIAICRALGLRTVYDDVPRGADLGHLEQHEREVRAEIAELAGLGLLSADSEESISLVGDASAVLMYDVAAQERSQGAATDLPFGHSFTGFAGVALSRSIVAAGIGTSIEGAELIGWCQSRWADEGQIIEDLALEAERAIEVGSTSTWRGEDIASYLTRSELNVAVVASAISGGGKLAETLSIWALPREAPREVLDACFMDEVERSQELIHGLGFKWGGMRALPFGGQEGANVLHRLALAEAHRAVLECYGERDLEGALAIAKANYAALSGVASGSHLAAECRIQYAFLLISTGRYEAAREAIVSMPTPDGFKSAWLIAWNLGIASAAIGQLEDARDALANAGRAAAALASESSYYFLHGWSGTSVVAFEVEACSRDSVGELVTAQLSLLDCDVKDRDGLCKILANESPKARPLVDVVGASLI